LFLKDDFQETGVTLIDLKYFVQNETSAAGAGVLSASPTVCECSSGSISREGVESGDSVLAK
jgi:hypothetical protein